MSANNKKVTKRFDFMKVG